MSAELIKDLACALAQYAYTSENIEDLREEMEYEVEQGDYDPELELWNTVTWSTAQEHARLMERAREYAEQNVG